MSEVFATPELVSSLSSYSESRQQTPANRARSSSSSGKAKASVLFLRIIAAADYYTTNKTLMQHVPPVDADLILDPFLLNVLPRSLLPTGAYLLALALVAWYISDYVWHILFSIATSNGGTETKKCQ